MSRLPWGIVLGVLLLALAADGRAQSLEVRSDLRVDLMAVLQHLARGGPSRLPARAERSLARFQPFRSHPAVARLALMGLKGFRGNVPTNYAVYLSTSPELRESRPVPDFFLDRAGGRDQLDLFLQEARDFVRAAAFLEWHASQGEDRARMEQVLRRTLSEVDLETPLVSFLGLRSWDKWIVVPSAFLAPGVESTWVMEEKPGLPDIYVLDGPSSWTGGLPSFGPPVHLASGIWSEPLFSTVYLMTELCRPQLRPVQGLCSSGWDQGSDEDCLGKRLVDALLYRVRERVFGPRRLAMLLRSRLDRRTYATVLDYERHRDRFPDLVGGAAHVLAALQSGGTPPECRLIDENRLSESLYARRLGWYLDMRLAQGPDAELSRVKALLEQQPAVRPP